MPVEKINQNSLTPEFEAFKEEFGINPLTYIHDLATDAKNFSGVTLHRIGSDFQVSIPDIDGNWQVMKLFVTSNPDHFEYLRSGFAMGLKRLVINGTITTGIFGPEDDPKCYVAITDNTIYLRGNNTSQKP